MICMTTIYLPPEVCKDFMDNRDVVIIGAGASGLMCAMQAGQRGRSVVVLDHAKNPGNKVIMAGGGKCNFTNYHVTPQNYISHNPHFCKSALKQYTQWDFLELVNQYKISFEERDHGQLFCRNSSRDILNMLLDECRKSSVKLEMNCSIDAISNNISSTSDNIGFHSNSTDIIQNARGQNREQSYFKISTDQGVFQAPSLVIATGGLSIPPAGASPLGYQIAEQFHINVLPPRAGLVPFTLPPPRRRKNSPNYLELQLM